MSDDDNETLDIIRRLDKQVSDLENRRGVFRSLMQEPMIILILCAFLVGLLIGLGLG